jgi:hypothetical protein
MVKVALAPIAILPIVQTPVPELYEPTDTVELTKTYPKGSKSFNTTPVAGLGPALLASNVNVIVLPTAGIGLLIVLITLKSALGTGAGVTEEVLFNKFGSG